METLLQKRSQRYYLKHKKDILIRVAEYRNKNREVINAKNRKKYSIDSEKRKQYQKEYRLKNKDKINKYHRKYYTTVGREKMNEIKRRWSKTPNGKHLSSLKGYRRRALLKNSIGNHSVDEWNELVKKSKGKCQICGKKEKLTKDHIVPLSKGGLNTINNIQPLCRHCNCVKSNKLGQVIHN